MPMTQDGESAKPQVVPEQRGNAAIICSQCGTELPAQARFCFHCGSPVTSPDPLPASELPDKIPERLQRLVPKEYAERLVGTRGRVERERRPVTILFSDVKGSTRMAEDLDPEDWMEIMDGAFDLLIEPVYRYEGTVARLMGDAILAFFGAPIAHEDDPERACRAALEIVAGAQSYAERLQEDRGISGFNVRVGINTGLVVVGEVGSDLRVEYTAMGDAVNLAARMEGAAQPGTVLIAEDTHRLIAPLFETEALGAIGVKGKADPVPVYRVVAAKALPAKPRGITGLASPLVGREAEFSALQEAVARLQAGNGGIVTLVGEAGIGKSRLVAELRDSVGATHTESAPHPGWVESLCLSYGSSIAYLLWLDVLRGVLGVGVEDAPATVRDVLRDAVRALCPDRFDDVYPFLSRMLSLPLDEEVAAALDDMEGEQLKTSTFQAVETFLAQAASDRRMVLVCEDLHWADPTSLELLEHLLPLTGKAPLLFLCVFRPERDHGCWHVRETASQDYSHCHTGLRLHALSDAESEALVGNLLRMEHLPKALQDRILGHAEGNPFYLEEVLRSLIDGGAIAQDEATGRWQATRDVADIAIPDTLQGVLMARIDRLQDETKRVLQMASVIGRIFLHRVLAKIAREERGLEGKLLTLQQEEMIWERARMPELEYMFKHHLTQEAAYNGLLKAERRATHQQVAEALERLFPERIEELVGLLAHHWERAGNREKAVAYLLKAGDQARVAYAHEEAIDHYQRALALLEEQDDYERAARVLMKLGLTYHTGFKFRQARRAYEEGFALWQRAGETLARPRVELPPAPHALRLPHAEFSTLDPTLSDSAWGSIIIRELFSTLGELTRELDILPDIAHHWEVLDGGRAYVFHLRDDVVWSDGAPVTAGDFEYALRRLLDPASGVWGADELYDLKGARGFHQGEVDDPAQVGVYCPDAWTLVAELEGPAPHFLEHLATCEPLPRHAVEVHGPDWAEPGNIVTNGPFRLESWHRGESLVLVRNPDYHGRRSGNVDRVELCFPKGWSSVVGLYEADRIDGLPMESWAMGSPDLDRLRQRHADEYITAPAPITLFLPFDVYRTPFDDARVRQALVLATDRETLAEVVMRGYNAPAKGGLVPPGQPGHSPGIALPHDPERARELLADAGYGDGDGFPAVEALTNVELSTACQFLREQWRQNLGIDIPWQTMEKKDFFAHLGTQPGQPPHMTIYGLVPSYLDPAGLVSLQAVQGGPIWRDETYERLLAETRNAMEQKERLALCQQTDALLIEQAVVMPLMYRRLHWLVKPWVHRLAGWLSEIFWKDVVLDRH
jgi:ABC-type oligopeptide transport system substrate-binding subunit/class 3 adenylate cyclase